jgi:hypothetical protein
MKAVDFNEFVAEHLKHIHDLTFQGQKEYAHGEVDNVFNNFMRVAADVEIPRTKALWTYLAKHLDGIKAHIKGHKSQREHVSGRINDAIVYLLLLDAMIWEDDNIDKELQDLNRSAINQKQTFSPEIGVPEPGKIYPMNASPYTKHRLNDK